MISKEQITEVPLVMIDTRTFRRYFSITHAYFGRRFFVMLGLNLLAAGAESFGILLVIPLIQQFSREHDGATPAASPVSSAGTAFGLSVSPGTVLLLIVAAFCFKGLLVFAVGAYRRYNLNTISRELRSRIVAALPNLNYEYAAKTHSGNLSHLLVREIDRAAWTMDNFCRCLTTLVTTICFMTAAILVQPKLTLVIVGAGAVNLAILKSTSSAARRWSAAQSVLGSALSSFLVEALHSFKYLKATGSFPLIARRIEHTNRQMASVENKVNIAYSVLEAIREPILVVLIAAISYYYILLLNRPVAPVIAAIGLLYRCMVEIGTFQLCWQSASSNSGSLENVFRSTADLSNNQEPQGGTVEPDFSGELQLNDVHYSYGSYGVLRGVTLSIPRRCSVAIVGRSGVGKTTLLNILCGVLVPDAGNVSLSGTDLWSTKLAEYRSRIGYVTQEAALFCDTIANNISMALGAECVGDTLARVKHAARLAHCEEFIDRLADGYFSLVEENGASLSAGQRQRLTLARELYRNPEILILDEPTSSLDAASEEYIRASLDSLRGRMTLVLVTHRQSTLGSADLVYQLEDGVVISSGAEVRNSVRAR